MSDERNLDDRAYDVLVALASAIPTDRAAHCITHHGCDCHQWANERMTEFRDAARAVLPVDTWMVRR